MSENPALNLLRVFFAGAGFQEVPPTRTYTREDLIRVVIGQQWAVAIATMMCARPKPAYLAAVLERLPCAVDVVDGLG
jgi:hypothetical protein